MKPTIMFASVLTLSLVTLCGPGQAGAQEPALSSVPESTYIPPADTPARLPDGQATRRPVPEMRAGPPLESPPPALPPYPVWPAFNILEQPPPGSKLDGDSTPGDLANTVGNVVTGAGVRLRSPVLAGAGTTGGDIFKYFDLYYHGQDIIKRYQQEDFASATAFAAREIGKWYLSNQVSGFVATGVLLATGATPLMLACTFVITYEAGNLTEKIVDRATGVPRTGAPRDASDVIVDGMTSAISFVVGNDADRRARFSPAALSAGNGTRRGILQGGRWTGPIGSAASVGPSGPSGTSAGNCASGCPPAKP